MRNFLRKLDWTSVLFLTLTPIATVALSIYYFQTQTFNPWMIPLFFFFYFAMGMSITGGYHRLFAHKAYDAHPVARFLYLFFGAGAFQNSARKWVSDHRVHHRYVDRHEDPYCINKGFWFAHLFWMFHKDDDQVSDQLRKPYLRDLDRDVWIRFQDKYYVPIAVLSCFILPMVVGGLLFDSYIGGLLFGGFLRMVIVHHLTFLINSACHYWGWQPYTDTNSARDNFVLAIFTYGEGYHNFHHIFHADYRNGIKWYHFDPTKWLIKFMAWIRLARNLKVTPDYEIFKAKMLMAEKRLRAQQERSATIIESMLETFKTKAEEAHARWNQVAKDYEVLKKSFNANSEEKLRQLRRDLQLARLELQFACRQWQVCLATA